MRPAVKYILEIARLREEGVIRSDPKRIVHKVKNLKYNHMDNYRHYIETGEMLWEG